MTISIFIYYSRVSNIRDLNIREPGHPARHLESKIIELSPQTSIKFTKIFCFLHVSRLVSAPQSLPLQEYTLWAVSLYFRAPLPPFSSLRNPKWDAKLERWRKINAMFMYDHLEIMWLFPAFSSNSQSEASVSITWPFLLQWKKTKMASLPNLHVHPPQQIKTNLGLYNAFLKYSLRKKKVGGGLLKVYKNNYSTAYEYWDKKMIEVHRIWDWI